MSVYTVDPKGEIDFPVLRKLRVSGLRRDEVAETIKAMLISRNLVKDPVVTVEYANLGFNVKGEVNNPTSVTRSIATILLILDALGLLAIRPFRAVVIMYR